MSANPLQLKRIGRFPDTPVVREMRRTAQDLGLVQLLQAVSAHVRTGRLPEWAREYIEEVRVQLTPKE